MAFAVVYIKASKIQQDIDLSDISTMASKMYVTEAKQNAKSKWQHRELDRLIYDNIPREFELQKRLNYLEAKLERTDRAIDILKAQWYKAKAWTFVQNFTSKKFVQEKIEDLQDKRRVIRAAVTSTAEELEITSAHNQTAANYLKINLDDLRCFMTNRRHGPADD